MFLPEVLLFITKAQHYVLLIRHTSSPLDLSSASSPQCELLTVMYVKQRMNECLSVCGNIPGHKNSISQRPHFLSLLGGDI